MMETWVLVCLFDKSDFVIFLIDFVYFDLPIHCNNSLRLLTIKNFVNIGKYFFWQHQKPKTK